MTGSPWQIRSSTYPLKDRWIRVRADSCISDRGDIIDPFFVLEYPDRVNCLVIDSDLNVLFVEQYRHGVRRSVLELPSGGIEEGESPEMGVLRELREELGYVGAHLVSTGVSFPNPASHTNRVHSFLAYGGRCERPQELEKGEQLAIVRRPFSDFIGDFRAGLQSGTWQSMHVASLFFSLTYIRNSAEPELHSLKEVLNKGGVP